MGMLTSLKTIHTGVLAASLLIAGAAVAQPGPGPAPAITNTPDTGHPPIWSSPELERLGTMLSGMWKTDAAVGVPGTEGETVQIVLSIGPVGIQDMPNALYFEVARADALHAPYRQAIFQLFDYKGKVRLRTYEFLTGSIDKRAMVGAWVMPEVFPPLSREQFIATLDVEGTLSGDSFTGQTPYPYPTAVGGAVEMTSRVELRGNRLITEDRGYAADGSIAWGQEEGGRYAYSKVDPSTELSIDRSDDGLVVVEYREGVGEAPKAGDTFVVHYHGWFTRDTATFDASRNRGIPYSYQYPGTMIQGWLRGVEGMQPGSLRRIYVPFELGYGEQGQPPRMPGRSNLIFEVQCMSVTPAPAPPAAAPAPSGDDAASPPANDGASDTAPGE